MEELKQKQIKFNWIFNCNLKYLQHFSQMSAKMAKCIIKMDEIFNRNFVKDGRKRRKKKKVEVKQEKREEIKAS